MNFLRVRSLKKSFLSLALLSLIGFNTSTAFAQTTNGTGYFRVTSDKIYAPDGKEFIPRGWTVGGQGGAWGGKVIPDADLITNCWKANTIRLASYLFGHPDYIAPTNTNDEVINAFTSRGVVVILQTGDNDYDAARKEQYINYWRETAKKYKNNPYVWFNTTGEVGGAGVHPEYYLELNQAAIKAIRDDAGAKNPILVGGSYWGQEQFHDTEEPRVNVGDSAHLTLGDQLRSFNGKSYDNILYVVHPYAGWNAKTQEISEAKFEDYIQRMHSKGQNIFFGDIYSDEVGGPGTYNDLSFLNIPQAIRAVLTVAKKYHIGTTAWIWDYPYFTNYGSDPREEGQPQRINNCQNPTNLSWMGQQVWDLDHNYSTPTGSSSNQTASTPAPTSTTRYEAEKATLNLASVNTNHRNYSGSGFVDGYWSQGASTGFKVNVPSAGTYAVDLHYANGRGSNQTLSLFVNGKNIKQVSLNSQSDWDTWGDDVEKVNLNSGDNNIIFKYGTQDSGNVNLDYIEVKRSN